MTLKKKKISLSFAYVFYAATLFCLIVYLRLPTDELKTFFIHKVSSSLQKKITVKKISPVFPLGVTLDLLTIKDLSRTSNGTPVFSAEKITATVPVTSLFSSKKIVNYIIDAYGGKVTGTFTLGDSKTVTGHINLVGIETDRYPLKELKILTNPFSASITGQADLSIVLKNKKVSEGTLSFLLAKNSIDSINIYGFSLPPLTYSSISGTLTLKKNTITVKEVSVKGNDGELRAKGTINLQPIKVKSKLQLDLKYKISSAYIQKAGIPSGILARKKDSKGYSGIKIYGTLGNPRVRL